MAQENTCCCWAGTRPGQPGLPQEQPPAQCSRTAFQELPRLLNGIPIPQEEKGVFYLVIFPTDCLESTCMSIIFSDALPPLKGSAVEGTVHHFQNDQRCGTLIGSAESDHSAQGKLSRRHPPEACCYDKEAGVWTCIWERKSEEGRATAFPSFLKRAPQLLERSPNCRDRRCVSPPSPLPVPAGSSGTCHALASPDKGEQERDLLQAQWQDMGTVRRA